MIELKPRMNRKNASHPIDCPGWVIGRKFRDGYRVDVVWRKWVLGPEPGDKVTLAVDGGEWRLVPDDDGFKVHAYAGGTGRYLRITVPADTAKTLGVDDKGYDFLGVSVHSDGGLTMIGIPKEV